MRKKISPKIIAYLSTIALAIALALAGNIFVTSTKEKVAAAQNNMTKVHNQISMLPQPKDIDIGTPSGSVDYHLSSYEEAKHTYTDIDFNFPSKLRLQLAGLLSADLPPKRTVSLAKLQTEYSLFITNYSQLLESVHKLLVYNPSVDFKEFDKGNSDTVARIQAAKEGLGISKSALDDIPLNKQTKDSINAEITALQKAWSKLEQGDLEVWVTQSKSSQKQLRKHLQNYWEEVFAELNGQRQLLNSYSAELYQ